MLRILLSGLVLSSCQAYQPVAVPPSGRPASLQIVPPWYYSYSYTTGGGVRPSRGPLPAAPPRAAQERPELPSRPVEAAPTPPLPQEDPGHSDLLGEANRRLESLNDQLQRLRRSVTRPANPRPPGEGF